MFVIYMRDLHATLKNISLNFNSLYKHIREEIIKFNIKDRNQT